MSWQKATTDTKFRPWKRVSRKPYERVKCPGCGDLWIPPAPWLERSRCSWCKKVGMQSDYKLDYNKPPFGECNK